MNSTKSSCYFRQNENENNSDPCKLRALKLVGFCNHCKNNYCSKHRLPETHMCENLENIKINQRILLEARLESEKSVNSKIQKL
jgi:predicted nucleic acid binding AN1-type Zn finger protein